MLPAFLLMLPVMVVDVSGGELDAAQTRKLVESELSITAVAPDDPRASGAEGRIEVTSNARTKKLTVTYRKVDAPVERTIELADDRDRAELDAAFLAGNLARDEAGELTPAPPEKPAPAPLGPPPTEEDDRRYAQLRAYVKDLSNDARANSLRAGALLTTVGVLLTTPAIYVASKGDVDRGDAGLASASAISGGVCLGIGIVAMIVRADPYQGLAQTVREQDAKSVSSEEALANVEKEWSTEVGAERAARTASAVISFVLAGLSLGAGAALLATGTDVSPGTTAYIMAMGGVNVVTGVASLLSVGPLERAHDQWHSVSGAVPRLGLGIAPVAGGGATGSFAMNF